MSVRGVGPKPDPELAEVQARLEPLARDGEAGEPGRCIVVCPSLSVDPAMLERHADTFDAYEQRFLYLLFLLRRPGMRVVMCTSAPVADEIVDYYLGLVPGPGAETARSRLELIATDEDSLRPLAAKLLDRPDLLDRIRGLAGERGFIAPYMVRGAERDLAVELGLPLYCPDSRFDRYGTKVGSRELFAEIGVSHPRGREGIGTERELAEAIIALRAESDPPTAVVVKHNDSVYGEGNAILSFEELPDPGAPEEADAVAELIAGLGRPYLDVLASDPGIVEELVPGEVRSPSAQVRTIADGEAGIVSTHDQILGGELGQSYTGASFPADPAYGPLIAAEAERLRAHLAGQGVVGRFGVDFVVSERADGWSAWAIEVNLREGGTTHPFGALYLLTGARYDPAEGVCRTPAGDPRYYVTSDSLEDGGLTGIAPAGVLAAIEGAGLGWDHNGGTGVVMHMLAALPTEGKCGATVIAATPEAAAADFARLEATLAELAAERGRDRR